MAGERVKLVVKERTSLGSPESRRMRKQGLIPGVLYGREQPVAIAIAERDLRAALTGAGGTHAVLDVVVDGGSSHSSILKEFQLDKIRGTITHVDLQEVRLDQPIQATVSVNLVGEAAGTKEGGILSQVTNEVNVEALPLEMPEHLDIDVSALGIGDSIRLAELQVPDGVTLLDDVDETVLATVTAPMREEELEAATAELADGGGEDEGAGEPAEGDADAGEGAEGEPAPDAEAGTVEG